jgi:hypothetical protein
MGSVIMSPKKQTASSKKRTASSSTTRPARDLQAAAESNALMRIPSPARFLLVILSSMLMSSVLFTYTSSLTLGDLGPISKHLEEWWEVGVLIAWRFAEVGVAWVLGFDGK